MRQLHILVAVILAVGVASASPSKSYRGYEVLNALPQDEADAEELKALSSWSGVDMWSKLVAPGYEATMMLAPGSTKDRVVQRLKYLGIPFTINPRDVQSMIEEESREQQAVRSLRTTSVGDGTSVRFDAYMTVEEVGQYLQELAAKYPTVTVSSIGKSHEGRDMPVIRISKNNGESKRAIFVDAGIHAREWITPATALYLINQLTEHASTNSDLLNGLDWYIVPVLNPDGYDYSHTTDRLWRKNRGGDRTGWSAWIWNLLCKQGVDLNRNFGYHWKESGASAFPCAQTFAGSEAFSEIEAKNLRDFIKKENADGRFKMYLSLHSYGPMILYPWGYSTSAALPSDVEELKAIATEANKAMVSAGSVSFKVINSAQLYAAAGASDDWVKAEGGIEKVFTLELHKGGSSGFELPASKIESSAKQTFAGLKVFAQYAKQVL